MTFVFVHIYVGEETPEIDICLDVEQGLCHTADKLLKPRSRAFPLSCIGTHTVCKNRGGRPGNIYPLNDIIVLPR